MARIRTVKPEFFTHEELFEAEKETGLPIRIAFAGLFTVADREGRFKWRPRTIKLAVLPYDDVDFLRVLDALVTRGWLVHYEVSGVEYGCITTFTSHQIINNRESASILPPPPEENIENTNGLLTRDPRVIHASSTRHEGKGKEGKGKEGEGSLRSPLSDGVGKSVPEKIPKALKAGAYTHDFEIWWKAYPRRDGSKSEAFLIYGKLIKAGVIDHENLIASVGRFADHHHRAGTDPTKIPHATTWLNQRRWEAEYGEPGQSSGKSKWTSAADRIVEDILSEPDYDDREFQ